MDSRIKKLDFNLLKLFHALMETHSVSAAADQLNITQSATSHALRRLREAFSDSLFVVTKEGMIPTSLALAAKEPIEEIITLIDSTFKANQRFDPLTSDRTFVIVASEYFELVMLPKLTQVLTHCAPNCKIEIRHLTSEVPLKSLQAGNVDLMIGFGDYFKLDNNLIEKPLLSDRLVCVAGKGNTSVGDSLNIDQYLQLKHIYPSPWGHSRNMVDTWLEEQGLSRDIFITVQNYLATPLLLTHSNTILTIPEKVYELLKHMSPIRMVNPPKLDYPSFTVTMVYHRLFENEPGSIWLRNAITDLCRTSEKESELG
jgi:DNA-binding transcriptional LysR family regulator